MKDWSPRKIAARNHQVQLYKPRYKRNPFRSLLDVAALEHLLRSYFTRAAHAEAHKEAVQSKLWFF